MQVIEAAARPLEDMSGSELLDHVDLLALAQREAEVAILKVAAQYAVVHNAETVDPDAKPGWERARRLGGEGTPEVAEFAAAAFGARLGVSSYSGRAWIADALDLQHRFPKLWARVEALEVKASYARHVTRRCRDLSFAQAAYVDARVTDYADGRVTWSRFESLVEAAIKAADPAAAAAREAAEAEKQFANPTRSTEHGTRGFYIRADLATVAQLHARVGFVAQVLADLGDPECLDRRRVKAVLILADPIRAVRLLADYAAWKDRPADPDPALDLEPGVPVDPEDVSEPHAPNGPADAADPAGPAGADGPAGAAGPGTGEKPVIDWDKLLPAVWLFVHTYGGAAGPGSQPGQPGQAGTTDMFAARATGIARVEGHGVVTEEWVRRHLGPDARFKITEVLDIEGQAPVDAYEIPERHRRAVRMMTPADTFPFGSSVSDDLEVDHTIAYRRDADGRPAVPGQSRIGNYGPLTTFHHRIKTHGGWQVAQPFPGLFLWRDPHGAVYLVDNTGTRRVGTDTAA
jgi:hypothetical protein